MQRIGKRLLASRVGAAAIEFALVLPLLVTLLASVLEVVSIVFDYQRATEATRRAARMAITGVSIPDLTNLATTDIVCTSSGSVACTGAAVSSSARFDEIVTSMQEALPTIQASHVQISYTDATPSGLPGAVTPMVTVSLIGLEHTFLVAQIIPGAGTSMTLPGFDTTQLGDSRMP